MMTEMVAEKERSLEAHFALPITPQMSRIRRRAASVSDVGDPDRPWVVFHPLKATLHVDAQNLCFEVASKLVETTDPSRAKSSSFSGKPIHAEAIRQTRIPRMISTSPFRTTLAYELTCGGISSTRQFAETGDIQELELAILFSQEGARINNMFDVMHAHRTISHIAYDKFIVTRDRKIGNTLIELLRQLLEKDDEDQKILHKRILAKILHEYYLSFGDPAAVEEAIAINRHLLDVTPSKPELVEILDVLGASLLNRGKATGNTADLREAVELLAGGLEERAEGQELDADMTTTMSLLATAKRTLAELTKDLVLAHEAVELYRRVIANLPPGDDEYGSTLALLAMSIQIGLYDRKEPGQDMLDEVMQLHKTALELMPTAHIYRPTCLYALAEHYIGLGKMNISTIASMYPLAIDHMLRALSLMQLEDPQRILIINSLVETQSCLAETIGDYRPLVETTSHTVEEIQNTRRAGTFDYVHVENTTAASLIRRAYFTGDRVPLEDGIRLLRETLVKQPNDVGLLLNLASALHLTHQVSNDPRALRESVVLYCQLDLLISVEHPSRPIFLQNYAAALDACSGIYSVGSDFHAGIMSLLDQALDVLPAGQRPERMKIHTNSGHILLRRYEDLKDPQHLDESAKHHRAALLLRSLTHVDRGLNLHDLACIAEHRAKLTGVNGYVLEAIALYEEALDVEPPGHPLRSSEMYALSRIYANSTYSVFDLHMAVSFLEQALADDDDTAPLSRVLEGIRSLKSIESQFSDEPDQNHLLQRRIFACYKHVVQSLPRAVCFSFTVERRSKTVQLFDATWLGHHAALHAAALAIQGFEDPLLAPELLEQCRSTFWSQALNLRRREFEGVPAHQADELRDLLHVLDAKIHGSSPFFMQHANIMEAENAIAARRRQAARASQLIREIREHSGLERFLMSRTMSEMLRDSKGEVAVLLVGTPAFSQVWVLGQSEVMPVRTLRLHITDQTLKELAAAAYKIDPSRLRGSTGDDDSEHDEPHVRLSMNTRSVEDKHFKRLLSETWLKVVQPIFDAMGLKPQHGRSRPRLHWCPTGVFTSIPLHAAGIYTGHGECSSDYVVSSYTPTLEALCLARKDMPVVTKADTRVLLVAESSAPGMPRLLSVEEEIRVVQEHLSVDVIGMEERSYGQGPAKAQIATVLSAIPDSPILHLACHGRQDLENPLESGFMLSDGILTVRKLMSLDLKNAFLAFLSACETAKGDPQHPDQNFHLAAAMLFVGFRSVIATMWSMGDADGPLVAEHIYSAFSSAAELDPDAIPYALDEAARVLRKKGLPPSRWATFVHIGA